MRTEVPVMRALQEFGLTVPKVLADSFLGEDGKYAAIYSLLPGDNLQKLSVRSKNDLIAVKRLLVRAVIRLTEATEFMQKHEVSKILPSVTLTEELQALDTKDNPWLRDLAYQEAFEALQRFSRISRPGWSSRMATGSRATS